MSSNVGGSSIDAKIAAAKHIEWVKALGGTYQIGAPAVARGSKKWMDVSLPLPLFHVHVWSVLNLRTGSLPVLVSVNMISSRSISTEQTQTN